MPTYPSHLRRLKAVELSIRMESLKPVGDRDLSIEHIVANATAIEKFVNESIRDPH